MKNISKGDEKLMGPLFPRLHVNDAEKGGPRAPPRNKMALYEQLSIPSQRFRTAIDNESLPPACTGQENVHDSRIFFSVQAPQSRHTADKPLESYPHLDAPVSQVGQQKKLDEDDFAVPIFLHSRKDQHASKYWHSATTGKLSPSNQVQSHYSMTLQGSSDENLEQNGIIQVRNNTGRQNKGSSKDTAASGTQLAFQYSLYSNEAEHSLQQRNTYEQRYGSPKNLSRLKMADCRFSTEQRAYMKPGSVSGHPKNLQTLEVNRKNSSVSVRKATPEDLQNHDRQYSEETTCMPIEMIHEDWGDESSETSAVESLSATDMSPDDVVGIIGLKHFWKARGAIVKQQRAFAIQVFELHRLIKVQKLIAESPHILLENIAHIAKVVVSSDVKKLPLEYIVRAPSNITKHRSDFEEINRKRERSAANVMKASLSSVQEGSQTSEYNQFPSRTPLTPNAGEPHMGSWGSYPAQAHQWLIPVMSPTEGLVYKPYSGHGFTAPVYGGPGPPGSTPSSGNFQPPVYGGGSTPSSGNFHPPGYGVLASHHQYPGMGVPTYVPPAVPHGYFPPYSMPIVNAVGNNYAVDHVDHLTMQGLQSQLSGGGANFSVQCQESLHLPSQNSGANSDVLKPNKPISSEVQISTASSPLDKTQAQSTGLDNNIKGNNPLSLFPSSPVTDIPSESPNDPKGVQQARVIRVVPHNRRSATESVARIFRSIQEERKQSDFV